MRGAPVDVAVRARRPNPSLRWITALVVGVVGLVALVPAGSTEAASPTIVGGTPDVHIDQSGTVVGPADVSVDIQVLSPGLADLGPLPDGTHVSAYSALGPTQLLFSVANTVALPGNVTARPRDIVLWDGVAHSIALLGDVIPDGVGIDAIHVHPLTLEVWLSLDTTIDLSGTVLREADVFDASLGLVFDADAAGVPAGLDVDGVSRVPGTPDILLSFDIAGTLGGVPFADEDVLRYDPIGDTWTLTVDASASQPAWRAADLDGFEMVPEPALEPGLIISTAALALLARRRRSSVFVVSSVSRGASRRGPRRSHARRSFVLATLATLAIDAASSEAADGVVPINQVCATSATGCLAGDAPGMPVEITLPGSYRLTGNLDLAGAAQGIVVTADDVTVDLGGFLIQGPGSCAGSPPSCSGNGSTHGVSAGVGKRVVVRSGVIRGVATGAQVGAGGQIERLTVAQTSQFGLYGAAGVRIVDNVVIDSESIAILASPGSLVARNTVRSCGAAGIAFFGQAGTSGYGANDVSACGSAIAGGRAIAGNLCDDGLCRRVPARLYYLTSGSVTGGSALGACDAGFHMASLFEVLDPSQLAYEITLGRPGFDTAHGPPTAEFGWVRTGQGGYAGGPPIIGVSGCDDWSNGTAQESGSAIELNERWEAPNATHEDPWSTATFACNSPLGVWCIED